MTPQWYSVTHLLQCPGLGHELTIGSFPLVWLGIVFGPTIFAVTSGYFVSEKVLFVRERRLLAERETGVDDNRLNTNCLQWHSESTAVMSHSQQYSVVI